MFTWCMIRIKMLHVNTSTGRFWFVSAHSERNCVLIERSGLCRTLFRTACTHLFRLWLLFGVKLISLRMCALCQRDAFPPLHCFVASRELVCSQYNFLARNFKESWELLNDFTVERLETPSYINKFMKSWRKSESTKPSTKLKITGKAWKLAITKLKARTGKVVQTPPVFNSFLLMDELMGLKGYLE